ncbi:MAG: MlaD family protein [Myxococcota bacterium]
MERDYRLSLIVGGFVIGGLALFSLAVLLLSSESGIFTPQYRLRAEFENVQGLMSGAPVWLAGREVGRVENVRFTADPEHPLEVLLRIDESVKDRIREDSTARIGTIGVLGDSYVEVTIGSAEARELADGDSITAITPASLGDAITTGTRALEQFSRLAGNLNGVVESFGEEEGGRKLASAIAAVGELVLEVQDGSGMLHSLIYDSYEGGGVESIEASLAALESMMSELESGDGLLHSLIFDPADQQSEQVASFLDAGARLDRILAGLEEGQGTMGLLLTDPTLYEDLKTLVGGAQRSVVVRSLIKMAADEEGQGGS